MKIHFILFIIVLYYYAWNHVIHLTDLVNSFWRLCDN